MCNITKKQTGKSDFSLIKQERRRIKSTTAKQRKDPKRKKLLMLRRAAASSSRIACVCVYFNIKILHRICHLASRGREEEKRKKRKSKKIG